MHAPWKVRSKGCAENWRLRQQEKSDITSIFGVNNKTKNGSIKNTNLIYSWTKVQTYSSLKVSIQMNSSGSGLK